MQTKNVNVNQAPQNNSEKNCPAQRPAGSGSDAPLGFAAACPAPPLPPRGLPTSSQPPGSSSQEVDGYGAYKPAPPPKPRYSPPPYRMPPYPLYGEPAIPGAAPPAPAPAATASGLHTHSSKFPIEREVILSSADKNSKIPILHEYKKQRPKPVASAAAIAPEGPSKQVAWTEDKKPMSHVHRAPYAAFNGHPAASTGAIPRTWHEQQPFQAARGPAPLPQQQHEDADASREAKAFPTRTYHTIKDMISSRFGNKLPREEEGVAALNNTPDAAPQPRPDADDDDDDEGGFTTGGPRNAMGGTVLQQSSGQSSDYEKATQRSTADSGRGSTVYSASHQTVQGAPERLDTSTESSDSPQAVGSRMANDSEWVDIVESELRQILDPKLHGLGPPPAANSTLSESISSLTPPLPPLSPGGGSSPSVSPQNSTRYKHGSRKVPPGSGMAKSHQGSRSGAGMSGSRAGWNSRSGSKGQSEKQHRAGGSKKSEQLLTGGKGGKMSLSASVFGLDNTDLTSTTTGLDSMLDGNTENNSSEDDLSTTIDATDAHAIRKQLEGLENMYSEVLKLLGVKKYGGRYQPSDPRVNKRRLYGSMSSLPSSVSSRPIRDKRRQDERKKVKDLKGINKRFQRLESHVVTLARSVAHLSSEMRTQHLMIQEMENIRGEIAALRTRSQSVPRGLNGLAAPSGERDALTNPARVKKLTKFFGDEPPLLRLFLKKLGYEKYAGVFEQERVGMVELPYLTEERLQKMGIPLGPRLRILQEAQISICRDSIYVV
ncbi:uncharacterized protein [Periplaneta americana]|uniref:uncharacterized protein n=1 Tax=Periplaneta americana TaxID=6978 RepID=UPI0037E758F4